MVEIKKYKEKKSENAFKNVSTKLKLFLTSFFERVSVHGFSYFSLMYLHRWEKYEKIYKFHINNYDSNTFPDYFG